MDLNSFMKSSNKTLKEAAAETGISYDLLRKYKNGERRPRLENMIIIREWTNGAVKADDWYIPANDNTKSMLSENYEVRE